MNILKNKATGEYYSHFEPPNPYPISTPDRNKAKVLLSRPAVRAIECLLPDPSNWEREEWTPINPR